MWDFYGYLNLKLDISRLRPWPKVDGSFGAIKLSDVTGINPNTFVKTAMLASEIEEPINAYSDNSGEVIRVISPQASRFMGKTAEEALALKNKQESLKKEGKRPPSYCTNSWCFEENRHEGTLATISQNIVGRPLPMNAPFSAYPNLNPLRVNDAFFHLIARNDTEWHAASAYFFLGAHSKNALNQWVANVRHDELKHMSIFGGLYKYLRGNTYNSRLKGMLLKMLEEIKEKDSKSDYADFASEPLSLLELAYVHIMYEKEIRLFFKSLPLKSLRKIYETKVNLEPLESTPIEASKLLQLKQAIEQETKMRKTLARWPKSQRKHYEELEDFEKQFDALIIKIISDLEYFKGAEDFENPKHIELISTINYMTESQIAAVYGVSIGAKQLALLKQSLQETIRDYQIMNNQTVRSLGLSVKFVDAHTGFDIVRDETYNSLKKAN
ncbi:MAG: hypothetical protein IPM57_09135 [Oligoflexia bacterium]|nr:hypothetical protein [Oligoflexia bacterium]